MIVYRLEMPDGGGPFFTLEGVQRRTGMQLPPSEFVFGCHSEADLDKYFKFKKGIPKECKVVVREIPDELCKDFGLQIMFPREIIKKG